MISDRVDISKEVISYLLNQTNVGSEPGQIEAPDVLAIELDCAGCGVVPPFEKPDDGTFTRTAWSLASLGQYLQHLLH